MRAALENWLLQHWYGSHQPPWFLKALEPLYESAFNRKQRSALSGERYRSVTPVVIVGNLTAGGTGKTPLVIRICQLAQQLGLSAGIASTGYGRKGRETGIVRGDSDTRLYGDEPVLLAKRTGLPVVVADNRVDAIKTLDDMGLDVIISDDGLQSTHIERDIEVCVIDGSRGFGNGHLIPAGPLREPVTRLSSIDYVVCNGQWQDKPHDLNTQDMMLVASRIESVSEETHVGIEEFIKGHAGKAIHAVAGIGNPERFFKLLKGLGIEAECHGFPDHHVFSRSDFDGFDSGCAILMTEKDAVKCRGLGLKKAWYLPVDCQLSSEFEGQLKVHMKRLTERST